LASAIVLALLFGVKKANTPTRQQKEQAAKDNKKVMQLNTRKYTSAS